MLKTLETISSLTTKSEPPKVSVIITTKNEERNIQSCIQSIKAQTYPNIELIVVDNFSKDKTVGLAQKLGAKVYLKGNERSAQRNYGVNVASGEFVIYIDADMILSPQLIEHCISKCLSCRFYALYIPEKIVGEGFWIKVRDFERSFYTGTVVDAVRFIRKDLFLKVGGFDETLIGPEDWDFDRKIRQETQTGIADFSLFHNEGVFNLKKYLGKKGYYTDGIKKYVEKWGVRDEETTKQVGARYRLIGVFVENGKWKKLILNLPYAVGMYYLRLKVALTYLRKA
jgi:glycosyltransferase involved in cell wall biosynthesis